MKALYFIILVGLLFACSKEKEGSTQDYIEIVINGETYKNEIFGGSGFANGNGCFANKPHYLGLLGEFETPAFRFVSYISYLQQEDDFVKTVAGSYNIQTGMESICNLNLSIQYDDKLLTNNTTVLQGSRTHQVTSIIKKGAVNFSLVEYQVKGNFSCSFRNAAGITVPITGNYQCTITVMK